MRFFKGIGNGFLSFFKAFGFVFNNNLWHYLLFSFGLWLLMFITTHFLISSVGDFIQDWFEKQILLDQIPDEGHWLSWVKDFVHKYLGFAVSWIVKLLLWMVAGTFTKYMTLILLSPILSQLSESIDKRLTGSEYKFRLGQFIKDILRGILINVRNMILEFTLILIMWIVNIMFPPFALISVPFLIAVSCYFVGFSMMDYTCERKKMSVIKSIRFIRSNMGITLGIGFCYWFFVTFIPLLGVVFAPVMAVTGATLCLQEEFKKLEDVQKKI